MLSNSEPHKNSKRIDLLFSKFAAFYGHVWRSQFKDEVFLQFAKKEWQEALGEFSDVVITKAIMGCLRFYELPPTLPQLMHDCRQIKKQMVVYALPETKPASKTVVESCLQQCKAFLRR